MLLGFPKMCMPSGVHLENFPWGGGIEFIPFLPKEEGLEVEDPKMAKNDLFCMKYSTRISPLNLLLLTAQSFETILRLLE